MKNTIKPSQDKTVEKKKLYKMKEVIVQEWYEKRKDGIHLMWEFEDGKQMDRLTPYNDIPWVKIKLPHIPKYE